MSNSITTNLMKQLLPSIEQVVGPLQDNQRQELRNAFSENLIPAELFGRTRFGLLNSNVDLNKPFNVTGKELIQVITSGASLSTFLNKKFESDSDE